ncbi:uncharacterized protein [Montipora foliosa]|uniref:uncharacterized protein n=1 Tax=Montipora foliosa TaxID=591990 RepID=UPI0035F105F9
MSVMKDITNLTNFASEDSHESSPERDIFISQVPRRKRTSKQAALDRFLTNEDELSGKSESETDEAAQSAFMTPEVEPRKKEKPQKRKRLRLGGNSRTVGPTSLALSVTLNGLSKSQLVDLMTTLVTERHPDLEQEVRGLVPEPDLTELEEKLKYLQRNIYKSFPYTRYGSSRDAFCYRRVNTHLSAFKKECVSQGNTLVSSQLWESTVCYVLMAWTYVDGMPNWDNPAHNKSKEQCFKSLAVQCKKALTKLKNSLTQDKCQDLLERMQEACEQNNELQPCVDLLTALQSKF